MMTKQGEQIQSHLVPATSNRTLYIHREYGLTSLKSERFLSLIEAVKEIESVVSSDMLDIEFVIDNLSFEVNLLQVRRITTQKID